MKRILLVSDYFPPDIHGGAEISTFELSKHLSNKHCVDVFTTYDENNRGLVLDNVGGVSVYRIHSSRISYFNNFSVVLRPIVFLKFYSFLRKNNYNLIHFNNVSFKLSFSILILPKLFGIPSIFTFRDATSVVNGKFNSGFLNSNFKVSVLNEIKRNKFNFNPFRNFLIRNIFKLVDHRISISNVLKDVLVDNGINVDQVYSNRIYFNNNHSVNINMDFPYLLYIGRPSLDKGVFDIIKLIKFFNIKYSIKLVFVGFLESDLPKDVRDYIKNNEILDFISFFKWIPQADVFSFIFNSLVVIYPSRYIDAFGRVVLEALLANTPVVVSKYAGASEILLDKSLVYDPFLLGDLESKLDYSIMNNSLIREHLKLNCEYYNKYNLSVIGNDYYNEFYNEIFQN